MTQPMKRLQLGKSGPTVSAFGLGCMGMSGMYGPSDRQESLATLHAAVGAGITLLDTGEFYGMGHNEMLIGARRRDRLAEALGSLDAALTAQDLAAIELAVPRNAAAGSRYPDAAMADLDSEK
jgi:aryl-alcohol dehydrogenase-like predicted oxidoreductase